MSLNNDPERYRRAELNKAFTLQKKMYRQLNNYK